MNNLINIKYRQQHIHTAYEWLKEAHPEIDWQKLTLGEVERLYLDMIQSKTEASEGVAG